VRPDKLAGDLDQKSMGARKRITSLKTEAGTCVLDVVQHGEFD
jgi:hypothetical protein